MSTYQLSCSLVSLVFLCDILNCSLVHVCVTYSVKFERNGMRVGRSVGQLIGCSACCSDYRWIEIRGRKKEKEKASFLVN